MGRYTHDVTTSARMGALRRHPLWRDAGEQAVRSLAASTTDALYHPGEAILSTGDRAASVHLLIEGAVRVFYPGTEAGAEVTVKLFWAPAVFGEAEAVLRVPWAETVEALTPARVLTTDSRVYLRIMQTEPGVCFRHYLDVAHRFGIAIRADASAYFDDPAGRVVALLVSYVRAFGRPLDGGHVIDLALTQEDIASQVGSNRRTIVRVLGKLYRSNLLKRIGRRYFVPSTERLLEASRPGSPDVSYTIQEGSWAESLR